MDVEKWVDTEESICRSSLLVISTRGGKSKQGHLRVRIEGADVFQGLNSDQIILRVRSHFFWLFYIIFFLLCKFSLGSICLIL